MMHGRALCRWTPAILTAAVLALYGGRLHGADLAADAFAVPPGTPYKGVLLSDVRTVKADLTVPADVLLKFDGGALDVAEGVTLTINGSIEAPMQRVFIGAGKVVFGPGRVEKVYPQWWGAKGDGAHDDTSAIQAAIDSLPAGTVFLAPGRYNNTGVTAKSNLVLSGAGPGATALVFTPATGSCITLPPDCAWLRIEHLRIASSARTTGCGVDGTNEYVRHFTMHNFVVQNFQRGIYIQQGMHTKLDYGYVGGPGQNVPGSVCVQFGDKALNKACTTATVSDLYLTNAQTDLYNRAAPCLILRTIFETCEIGFDNYCRATVIAPFFAGCTTAAARLTDNGAFFIGPYPKEYTILYGGKTEENRTSFFPDTFDSPMKLGLMELSARGDLTLGGKALSGTAPEAAK